MMDAYLRDDQVEHRPMKLLILSRVLESPLVMSLINTQNRVCHRDDIVVAVEPKRVVCKGA